MTYTTQDLKKAMNLLKHYSKLATQADEYFESHPFDEDAEKAFDRAYENEYNAFIWAVEIVSKMTGLDEKTAREMIRTKENEILALVERAK